MKGFCHGFYSNQQSWRISIVEIVKDLGERHFGGSIQNSVYDIMSLLFLIAYSADVLMSLTLDTNVSNIKLSDLISLK